MNPLQLLWSGRRRWVVLGLLWVLCIALLKVTWLSQPEQLPMVSRLNHLLYDARFSLLPPKREAKLPIVIVDLDEFSIQREGRWPWPRSKMAQLLQSLQQQGAALIGLDIAFSEASSNPVQQILEQANLPESAQQQLREQQSLFDQDAIFANSLAGNTVLGYFFHNDGQSSGQLPFPFYQLDAEQQHNQLLKMHNYSSNIPLLANHALEQGFVVTQADIDGVIRRLPLVIEHQGDTYASFSLVMAQLALGEPWLKLKLVDNGAQFVATKIDIGTAVTVPIAADASMLVPYRGGARSYPTLSATRIMRGDLSTVEQAAVQGAIILIGTSAMGLSDLRTIPLQTNYPGVEAHANVIDALLQAAMGESVFYYEPDWAPAASLLLLLVTGMVLAIILPGRSPLWMLLYSVLGLSWVVGLNFYLWQAHHLALPLALQLLLVLGLSLFNLALGFFASNRHRREVQELFGAYVPPAYVERLLEDPKAASMEGEQRKMTVLFADIMGFTTLSEALTTAELKQLLNRYLTKVTEVIFAHQGTIDKYVGDMVMAFWNAPLDDPQHAQNAVLAALAMQQQTALLSQEFIESGLPALEIGIGLNTGPMNVGDMGSHYRRAYTVLGDAVNLGSRIESITRYYSAQILVSDATQEQCPDIIFLPVDRIQVKGKTEPVEVFEPLCPRQDANEQLLHKVATFTQALQAYRQQDFNAASQLLQQLLNNAAQQPDNHSALYQLYLERCTDFIQNPPAADWQAVFIHTNK